MAPLPDKNIAARQAAQDTFTQSKEDSKISYSIEEVCAMTGVGRTTIYKAISGGTLTARRWGARVLVLKADLEKFLNGLKSFHTQEQ